MNQLLTKQYDSLYSRKTNPLFDDSKVADVIATIQNYCPSGTVLDIGAGDGRFAVPLAAAGYKVTAIDLSAVGLEEIQQQAKNRETAITTIVSDIAKDKIAGLFDCILFCSVLFHLETAAAAGVIKNTKPHTAPGGIHLIRTFSDHGELAQRNRGKGRFYPDESTLRRLYHGWGILKISCTVTTAQARRKDGERMKNEQITFIAQRPF